MSDWEDDDLDLGQLGPAAVEQDEPELTTAFSGMSTSARAGSKAAKAPRTFDPSQRLAQQERNAGSLKPLTDEQRRAQEEQSELELAGDLFGIDAPAKAGGAAKAGAGSAGPPKKENADSAMARLNLKTLKDHQVAARALAKRLNENAETNASKLKETVKEFLREATKSMSKDECADVDKVWTNIKFEKDRQTKTAKASKNSKPPKKGSKNAKVKAPAAYAEDDWEGGDDYDDFAADYMDDYEF